MQVHRGFLNIGTLSVYLAIIFEVGVDARNNECQTNQDCNNDSVKSEECKQGFKGMSTECECLREMWCRDWSPTKPIDQCPFLCYPKKVAGCEHWGANCRICKKAKNVDPCIYKNITGICQENGKCEYPDQKCRTNVDCEDGKYCTWHDIHVSGSCDPGYYSPNNCPLGECKAYETECYTHVECGPDKFCTEADCMDEGCPPGDCLACDPSDPSVIASGINVPSGCGNW